MASNNFFFTIQSCILRKKYMVSGSFPRNVGCSVSGKNVNQVPKFSQHFQLCHLHVWDLKHMYFPPFNNTEDWHFSYLSLRIDCSSALARVCLWHLIRERKRKEEYEKRFVGIVFICSSRVSKLLDCIILGNQRIMFLSLCMCVCVCVCVFVWVCVCNHSSFTNIFIGVTKQCC